MNPQAITTTFDNALDNLGKSILSSYTEDEHGAPVEIEEDQMAQITTIIQSVTENAETVFKPLYDHFMHELTQQKKMIDALSAQLIGSTSMSASASTVAVTSAESGDRPTVAWLQANRKSKKEGALTGYNAFTMWYMAKNKNGFPAKGTWAQEDQKFYKALADDYNRSIGVTKGKGKATDGAAVAASIELPVLKGKGKAVTAFNVWTKDYMDKNPGAGFPPKGLWAKVPKDEVAKYQAQAKAIQAQRA